MKGSCRLILQEFRTPFSLGEVALLRVNVFVSGVYNRCVTFWRIVIFAAKAVIFGVTIRGIDPSNSREASLAKETGSLCERAVPGRQITRALRSRHSARLNNRGSPG